MTATNDPFGLDGRICVVTGGGSGIGRAVALALAAEGAAVAVLDRDEPGANETMAQVAAAGGRGLAHACDVSDEASVRAAHGAICTTLGEADVLVNNAGIMHLIPLADLSVAEWNRLLSINLTGYFICSQVFGAAMRARGEGALVHVSSITAEFASPACGAYSVAKAGVTMLSRLLAVEWGPAGLRSNAVYPGLVQTPMSGQIYSKEGVIERRSAAVPLRRIGQPMDIAQAVVFLASARATYINGVELAVDGGFTRNVMSLVPR